MRLRTDKPWKVPLLFGRLPGVPDVKAPTQKKGHYALFMMMMFRPFRLMDVFIRDLLGETVFPSEDVAWDHIYNEFSTWRAGIEKTAKECYDTQRVTEEAGHQFSMW